MNRIFKYGFGLVVLAVIVGTVSSIRTSSQKPTGQVAAQPTRCPAVGDVGSPVSSAERFAVKFVATAQGDAHKPTIVGRTNLPAGTELIVSLEREASAYKAESKSVVGSDGCFTSEPFSQGGEPINPGAYVIDVLMPVTGVQPQSVRAIVGDRGQNIIGPLVKRFAHLGKIAEYKASFIAGAADTQKDADARQSATDDDKKRRADLRLSAVLLATKILKENLRNPASADWISVNSNEDGSTVCMTVRAQNGFGGMNIEHYAVVDQKFSESATTWNKSCAGTGFYDLTPTVKLLR
jgi:hypothetical protein